MPGGWQLVGTRTLFAVARDGGLHVALRTLPAAPVPLYSLLTMPIFSAACTQDDCDECSCLGEEGNNTGSRRRAACCGLSSFFVFIVLFAMSWDTLEPTEYGLVQNGFTGYVDLRPTSVYEGGRYFIWLVRVLSRDDI